MIILIVIIGLSVLILVHELGHFLTAKMFGVKVEEFGFGFPPRILAWRPKRWLKDKGTLRQAQGETEYSFNWLPFGGFVKIFGEDAESGETSERSFVSQSVWKRSVIVLAGVFMNIILGWLILSIVLMVGSPEHLMISEVAPQSPAAITGLKPSDLIISASYGSAVLTDPIKSESLVDLVKSAKGEEVLLQAKRGGEILDFSLRGRLNPPPGEGAIGVALLEIGFPASSFFDALGKGLVNTSEAIQAISVGFLNLFTKIFVNPEIVRSLTGPVGIFAVANQTGQLGFIYLFQLIALISLNLAVLNFIPFPALDGGRFLFLIIEKIKGSPVSYKFQRIVNTVGFALLVILMIVVTVQDIIKIGR
ncbi:MAG: site-2 protease family protein [Patescibacteria group bacterium]